MKRALLPVCLLAMAATATHAQVQEKSMQDWVDGNFRRAVMATQGSKDPSAKYSMSDKKFGGGTFDTGAYTTSSFTGTKSAPMKTFQTRSFLGIKNPWFGRKIYDTYANSAATRISSDAKKQYATDTFGTRAYDKADRSDLIDANTAVPASTRPRPYIAPAKAPGVIDRFTQNLHKDLSIDDVRELLNKGHGE